MSEGKALISQGAEARVYALTYLGREAVVKERFPKRYRHPILDDKITRKRVISECRIMAKASKIGLLVPSLLYVSLDQSSIYMERVPGRSVKELFTDQSTSDTLIHSVLKGIGKILWKMHQEGIIHGDLTTSNMIYQPDGAICLIDFGLAFISGMEEDKAVDLYVLERAIQSTHPRLVNAFECLLQEYAAQSPQMSASIVTKLDEVRLRGRKKSMVG